MISDAVQLATLVQQAPALVIAILGLLFSGWTYRQARRSIANAEARLGLSAVRQGKRIGRAENGVQMLDLRRRITEAELLDLGVQLSYWPPDGPDQPRPRRDDDRRSIDNDRDDPADDGPDESPTAFRPEIPPLPDYSRHRR